MSKAVGVSGRGGLTEMAPVESGIGLGGCCAIYRVTWYQGRCCALSATGRYQAVAVATLGRRL